MEQKKRAYFYITHELLRERLGIPDDVLILGVAQTVEDQLNGQLKIHVYHPSLREVPESGESWLIDGTTLITGYIRK